MTHRERYLLGLRELADFLAVNPDVPVPSYPRIQVSASGSTDDEKWAFVDRAALAMGVKAADPYGNGEAWQATLHFGPIEYYAIAHTKAHMDEYDERNRLGAEALAAKQAAAVAP